MQLHHIVLQNFRQYKQARFNFHPHFTVLIGNNGAGKTTVLDAIALLLNTYFQGSGIVAAGGSIKKEDARLVIAEKAGQVFRERARAVRLSAAAGINGVELEWFREIGDRAGNAKNLVQLGMNDRARLADNPDLPLLLYYGAGRLWDVHHAVETEKPESQLDAYRYCLDPKSDQKAFEKWFKRLAYSELQKGHKIPALSAVKNAVLICIPGAQDFYYDTGEDQIMIKLDAGGLQPFNYLSDGYRNMVAMVADIAHRASRLNPQHGSETATLTKGVVLIDEIDLHLHPKWQRCVVDDLQKAFPNLQFIATTHSPFILQSLAAGEVIDLDNAVSAAGIADAPEGLAAPGPANAFSQRSIEDIVETVMGVEVPQRSERYRQMFDIAKQYYALLEQGQTADEMQKQHIKMELDRLSAPFSDNIAYYAFLEMKRLAAGMSDDAQEDEKCAQ